MGKPLVFSRCSDSERAAVEELIEEYHRGDIRSFDVLSVRVHQRIGIHVSKSTIRRIYQRMFGEEQKERCGREKENNERILAELFDQYKRGEKSSWRQMAIRAQEAGISTSKSTLFRRFKKEQDDDRVRSMIIGSIAKTDESEEQNEPFVERISLSRHLRATLLNVYEDGGLRQYSLIRGDISTGRQYYRCTRCAEWKKKRSEGKIAYISVVKGRIVSQSGAHHPSCEPLDENKVFAKAVDRQCRLDVRKEGTNPRLSYTKGIQRMMGTNLNACSYFPPWNTVRRAYYRHRIKGSGQTPSPSPTTSDSQGTVDGRVTEVIHGENGQPQISQVSSSVGPTSQRLLVGGDADLMVPRLNMSEERWHTDDEGQGSVKTEPEESNFKREDEQTSEAARRSSTFVMRTRQVGSKPTAGYERRTTGNSCGRMVSRVVGIKRLQREKRPVRIRYTVGNYLQHRIHQSVEDLIMVDVYLKSIREASSPDETSRCVCDAIGSEDLFAFGELLSEPKVMALKDSPQHAKFYKLLELFAYGTYSDVLSARSDLPELSDSMVQKLRQLTLLSMCTQSRCIAIKDAMEALHLENLHDLHSLFISAIYKGILQGRVNSEESTLEITSWKSRDVTDEQLAEIREKLRQWIECCASAADSLRAIASNAENAIVEAAANEAKVEEEVNRVRKKLQEGEEQRGLKDYRRPKSQRGKKHP